MALTKISGDVIQSSLTLGIATATSLNVGTGVTIQGGGATFTGVVTATTFSGNATSATLATNAQGLTGTPNITVGSITAATATFSGNISVAGTVTYEDVTNVDSVGVITARSSVVVGAGLSVVGVTTLSSAGGITTTGGSLFTKQLDVLGSSSTAKLNLSGISSSISDTAVDIFIYDTRKDSDGGAWRKRTQHTSWYNETLNTATRGSRREFPAVAVIVATTTSVTIYDGDDPDMPMWMVFEGQAGGNTVDSKMLQYAYTNGYYVHALNGILVIGQKSNSDNYGSPIIRFISEYVNRMDVHNFEGGVWKGNIADRNSTVGYIVSASETYVILNSIINDVAMTVLPNAPIDDATGLPIPTIAVATAGGVSVIKDDGTVVDLYQNHAQTTTVGTVVFDSKTNNILFTTDYSGGTPTGQHYKINASPIPSADTAATTNYYRGFQDHTYKIQSGGNVTTPKLIGFEIEDIVDMGGNGLFAVRTTTSSSYGSGLNIFKEYPGSTNTDNSIITYISSNYNTGWMHGNIKGAFLSDTDATNVTGTELVTNGDFSTSTLTSYGQLYNCSLSVVSNQLRVTSTSSVGYCEFYVTIPDTTKVHYFSFQFVGASATTQFGIYGTTTGYITDTNAGWSSPNYTVTRSAGTYTLRIPSGNLRVGFVFNISALGQTWTFDNISLREATELDRSVNDRGLQVFGTITKSAVATGAELVAYSGFSNDTNFLRQPYNSALDFGTGDFSATGWFKMSDISTTGFIFDRANVSSGGSRIAVYTEYSLLKFYTFDGSANTEETSSISGFNNVWVHFVAIRSSNGYTAIYLNGNLKDSMTATSKNVTNTTASTTIGARFTGATNAFSGSIALLRISGSIPSPEQIKKIYEDEKALFQPNSQCTLYGSSDAVTALAYDEDLQLLHVGTSSGRSDFQGLRRINNTTTAVTTAISASNGLVAEQ